jgi:hypothetical protein
MRGLQRRVIELAHSCCVIAKQASSDFFRKRFA